MKVSELLNSPEKWTKGASARDEHNNPCYVGEAVKWCLFGALLRCSPHHELDFKPALAKVRSLIPNNRHIADFNDDPSTTFEDIRKIVELADV